MALLSRRRSILSLLQKSATSRGLVTFARRSAASTRLPAASPPKMRSMASRCAAASAASSPALAVATAETLVATKVVGTGGCSPAAAAAAAALGSGWAAPCCWARFALAFSERSRRRTRKKLQSSSGSSSPRASTTSPFPPWRRRFQNSRGELRARFGGLSTSRAFAESTSAEPPSDVNSLIVALSVSRGINSTMSMYSFVLPTPPR
mmetsp:Transcript_20373/g.61889  ORF Transcript_20373/g.61889 Transcript_20373/m.61889 type:complete len:207 (+) Transcript_20373:154-774(+)